ncbi:MAG: TM1812 family CRISPR-associated protein [Lachnospiraceae bacterium]|nr:TM1812 family CRISPR-associated protein [Lachnospiraceae bacterium]
MNRTFITSISIQPTGMLKRVLYQPMEFQLTKNRETSFPILPIIAEYMEGNPEENTIIAIIPDNVNAMENYSIFKEELARLGISKKQILEIDCAKNQGKRGSITMLLELLEKIPEDSCIYTDITYNTKTMSAMVIYAMQFIEKIKNTEVEGIYYGELTRDREGKPTGMFLYDITIFKHFSDIFEQLQILGATDITGSLKKLIEE